MSDSKSETRVYHWAMRVAAESTKYKLTNIKTFNCYLPDRRIAV